MEKVLSRGRRTRQHGLGNKIDPLARRFAETHDEDLRCRQTHPNGRERKMIDNSLTKKLNLA